jgi:MtN3 and saliva related transmembrane protein
MLTVTDNTSWVTILGLMAACCTTTSFLPQAIQTVKTKDTSAISLSMYILFTFGTLIWFIYGLASHNIPVALANGITLILAAIILAVKIRNTIACRK